MQQSISPRGAPSPLLYNKASHPEGCSLLCLTTKPLTPWGGASFAALSYSKSKCLCHPFVAVNENSSPVAPKTPMGHCFHFAEGKGFCSSRRARGPRRWRGDPEAVRLRDPRASAGGPSEKGRAKSRAQAKCRQCHCCL